MTFAQLVIHLAVAFPALLLPSCHSLHVLEDDHGSRKTLVFGVHHKTGTELAHKAGECFGPSMNHRFVRVFSRATLHQNEGAVHFNRNPLSLALSSYLYHKETGEIWTLSPGSAKDTLSHDEYFLRNWVNGSESYSEFLRRVPQKIGLRAQVSFLVRTGGELEVIKTSVKNCAATNRCMAVCLEDFTGSSRSFDASWRHILNFMGKVKETPKMRQCFSKEDLNRNIEDKRHVTSFSLPEDEINTLMKLVLKADALFFNSTLSRLAQDRHFCGGAKGFAQTWEGRTATYGVGYTEWLREEMYS